MQEFITKGAALSIGTFYYDHGEFNLAKLYLEKTNRIQPSNANILSKLADLHFKHGHILEALDITREAITLLPHNNDLNAQYTLYSYFANSKNVQILFEKHELTHVWRTLELIRKNNFLEADSSWVELQKEFNAPWLQYIKYRYLQMKIREGKNSEAIQIFEEITEEEKMSIYQMCKTDYELNLIRNDKRFIELIRKYFPYNGND